MYPLLLCALAVLIVGRFLYNQIQSPVRSIPGPVVARFTRLWYFRQIWQGNFHHNNIALHRRYGPIVRVGPDMFSISEPDKAVYGISSKFPKSDWYDGLRHPNPDLWQLFPERNMKRHAETRRIFQHMYSLSELVNYEKYCDICTEIFEKRLEQFAAKDEMFDMSYWFQCYAFDAMGEITYSKRFGFLDEKEGLTAALAALQRSLFYSSVVGVYAWAHPWAYAVMERVPGSGAAGRTYIMNFVRERMKAREEERKTSEEVREVEVEGMPQDFLDKILTAHERDPVKVTDHHVFMMGLSNILAGSDTTGVTLSSIFYHLGKYPRVMKKLRDEIDVLERDGKSNGQSVRFKETLDMPYLQAVIKEGMRMHPATGLPLWRVVPEGGAEVAGQYFPAGAVVGLNTWVAHYDQGVFEDAHEFRPERWLEAETEGGERLKKMEAYFMPFGLGSRTCIGRHISMLEISKLVPQLVRRFDFELERPDESWKTLGYWFVKPVSLLLRVRSRTMRSVQ